MRKLFVFGDSFAATSVPNQEGEAWCDTLASEYYYFLHNHALGGTGPEYAWDSMWNNRRTIQENAEAGGENYAVFIISSPTRVWTYHHKNPADVACQPIYDVDKKNYSWNMIDKDRTYLKQLNQMEMSWMYGHKIHVDDTAYQRRYLVQLLQSLCYSVEKYKIDKMFVASSFANQHDLIKHDVKEVLLDNMWYFDAPLFSIEPLESHRSLGTRTDPRVNHMTKGNRRVLCDAVNKFLMFGKRTPFARCAWGKYDY